MMENNQQLTAEGALQQADESLAGLYQHLIKKHEEFEEKFNVLKGIKEAKEFSEMDRWIQNRGLDTLVEGYLYKDNVKRPEIIEYM